MRHRKADPISRSNKTPEKAAVLRTASGN